MRQFQVLHHNGFKVGGTWTGAHISGIQFEACGLNLEKAPTTESSHQMKESAEATKFTKCHSRLSALRADLVVFPHQCGKKGNVEVHAQGIFTLRSFQNHPLFSKQRVLISVKAALPCLRGLKGPFWRRRVWDPQSQPFNFWGSGLALTWIWACLHEPFMPSVCRARETAIAEWVIAPCV